MQIFENSPDGKWHKAIITSEIQIFARYEDLVRLAIGFGINSVVLEEHMNCADFPSPINLDKGTLNIEQDGIWVYERVLHYIGALAYSPDRLPSSAPPAP